ncbi:galactoside 2-alpha-L-fucosyltransferase 2-like [Agrilus planipennis]|uniref:L-Fucosyltransferase n=1 Tax=Agrilus planipennis TaxID=224129 RepID=A0A1W4XTP7_AGRPL|nr:galactoside 2-alpha-L-fucosyltransferase 2-like [Agrilus planipennis]
MYNINQNILFTAIILALCVSAFVHVFLFPLYISPSHTLTKSFVDLEQSLCTNNILKYRKEWARQQCPLYGIVTTMQGGRLGNQMWEYASVWAVARRTGLEPYVPRCIRVRLDQVFESLSVPTLEEIAHCPVDMTFFVNSLDAWNFTRQSIILPRYSLQPDIVLSWVQDIISEFTFKKKLFNKSQQILQRAAKNISHPVFVGVHVRRTDYIGYLWRKHTVQPASFKFYYAAMKYYNQKYKNVVFIVVSDEPAWCIKFFGKLKNVYITSRSIPNSPSLDLAILSSCNHSIIDYGTFGTWGAILAGGETIFYNISQSSVARVGQILPHWKSIP